MKQLKLCKDPLVAFLLLITLVSCENQENKFVDTSIQSENKPSLFMSNEEVELLIEDKHAFFINYWIGMTKEQEIEVTRYLLSKEVISGIVYDPGDDSKSVKRCFDTSLDFDNECDYVEFNKNNYYLLNSSKSKKLLVLINHTRFEIEFIYTQLNSIETLSEIRLSAIDKITTESNVRYIDFINISKIYIEKYGAPLKSNFNNQDSGFCVFSKESNTVDISFRSDNNPSRIEGFRTPSQIHIRYCNENRLRDEKEYQKRVDGKIKEENDKQRQELEDKVHSESLKKI